MGREGPRDCATCVPPLHRLVSRKKKLSGAEVEKFGAERPDTNSPTRLGCEI